MVGDPRGFLKNKRIASEYRPVCERVKDYKQVFVLRPDEVTREQARRCMDCGTPFCHSGCPIGNIIPEWNEFIYHNQWQKAFDMLNSTNNLPEITGRVCPAPCEYACVLGINNDPVTIRENELGIIEHAFKEGLIKANPPKVRTGKSVAVVGSGPAGLSCAAQLNSAGHKITVFERDEQLGGIMRYGIPDFKLEKSVLDRRIDIWKQEGIEFKTNTNIGKDIPAEKLTKEFDAVCLTGGAKFPRDLAIEGRNLKGIYFAMEYLTQSNKLIAGANITDPISAKGKSVVVIGGGDTGSDCVGTANRQGASCVVQIELMPMPSKDRTENFTWPKYPLILKTSSSHEEGVTRKWSIMTKSFKGQGHAYRQAGSRVMGLECMQVDEKLKEIPGTEFEIKADLVFLALGFLGPEKTGMITELRLELDPRSNIKTDANYMTSRKGVFSAGDMRRGQSLIVWAISEGRKAARLIDEYLVGDSTLPIM
ncbi:glutamate synthase subunit beta [Candidatus Saganbacteria bacterium]|nr:glutamate synthase subunit beta [Candidatus Saganbacteria bacterium]